MKGICTSCGNDTFLQNKKGQCGECVFKKNHGGKSRQEVYQERQEKKVIKKYNIQPGIISPAISPEKLAAFKKSWQQQTGQIVDKDYHQDEESAKNERNQNQAEENEKQDQGFGGVMPSWKPDPKTNPAHHGASSGKMTQEHRLPIKKKQKSIKKMTPEQAEIKRLYKIACDDMDYTSERVCSGCLKYQGEVALSHSHIISQKDCKAIGRPELIYDRENLAYHCMGSSDSCHLKHENPVQRKTLLDYKANAAYIKTIDVGLYNRFISKE